MTLYWLSASNSYHAKTCVCLHASSVVWNGASLHTDYIDWYRLIFILLLVTTVLLCKV